MTQQLTPPPELVQQWRNEGYGLPGTLSEYVAARAAQWGADQELEACCEWLMYEQDRQGLRAARRPKPKSLKEEALAALHGADDQGLTHEHVVTIRRALEQLPDDN